MNSSSQLVSSNPEHAWSVHVKLYRSRVLVYEHAINIVDQITVGT